MDKYPPINPNAMKQSCYKISEDEEDDAPKTYFRRPADLSVKPPFKMVDRPRGGRPKEPTGAKEETGEVKRNEESKQEAKQPLFTGQKVFIKATNSRFGERWMEEMNNDPSSYTLGLVTPEIQAKCEPDFIGDAFYYNLTKTTNLLDIEGDYLILYTRPVGSLFDAEYKSAVISPNIKNKITIATRQSRVQGEIGRNLQQILEEGHWAAGSVVFQGMRALLSCEKLPDNTHISNRNTAHAKFQVTSLDPLEYKKNPFGELATRDAGSTISFGLKPMEYKWDEERRTTYLSGFHFAKLEIPCYNQETRKSERQLVVAVKIPIASDGNVASAFILKQRRFSPRDIAIIESDTRVRDWADWRNYGITTAYVDQIPFMGWSPQYPQRLGIEGYTFDISAFEQYLLTVSDPIRELRHLTAWIKNFVVDEPAFRAEEVLFDVARYMENRFMAARGELELRQSLGAERLISSLLKGAEDQKGRRIVQGGRDLGDRKGKEEEDSLGEDMEQNHDGDKTSGPGPLHLVAKDS